MPAPPSRGRAMSRLWGNDEELAKKDDDLTDPRILRQGHHQWQSAGRIPRRTTIARFAAYALVAFLLIVGLTKLFSSQSSSAPDRSLTDRYSSSDIPSHDAPKRPQVPDDRSGGSDNKGGGPLEPAKTYSGPLKLPQLGQSLHAIGGTGGKQPKNRNVLFAAASLKSAATLLPFACQMAFEHMNYVHFTLMGRSEISLLDLLKINGIDNSCPLIIHDARPDYPSTSTTSRMMLATARAMHYVNLYMHPQAIFVDSTSDEEEFFLLGVRDQVRGTSSALIELPRGPGESLAWVTKLDSASLSVWDKVHVDIVIHATPNGSGNLRRLLTSLAKSDLGAMSAPHLTIELPNVIEPQVERFLAGFQWPPVQGASPNRPHMLTLRHRIPRQKLTDEESSVRFLESFWPAQPSHSHVLVLSPHTEVSPQFFHYLKYTLLHHRYSNSAIIKDWDSKMLGISFSAPSSLLDNSGPLTIPQGEGDDSSGGAFLWQAPNSDATLYSGEKWVELHGFVSQVLDRQHSSSESPMLLAHKEVSKKYPSWLEYILQLSRLRGYYTVYPGPETASIVLGVHSDLPEVPEEYDADQDAHDDAVGEDIRDQATLSFDPYSKIDILGTLPQKGGLPSLSEVPILSWDGKEAGLEQLESDATAYAAKFRREVGQCEDGETEKPIDRYARDLFCTS